MQLLITAAGSMVPISYWKDGLEDEAEVWYCTNHNNDIVWSIFQYVVKKKMCLGLWLWT